MQSYYGRCHETRNLVYCISDGTPSDCRLARCVHVSSYYCILYAGARAHAALSSRCIAVGKALWRKR